MRKKPKRPKKRLAKKHAKREGNFRQYIRLDVDFCFDFDYNDSERDVNSFQYSSYTTRNISSSGLSFICHFQIPKGVLLKFKLWKKSWHRYKKGFIKPDWISAGEPKYVTGEVVRSEPVLKRFEIGVHFTSCNFRWLYYDEKKKRLLTL